MAWTTPASVSTGDLVTSTWLNTYIRDNMNAMFPIGTFILRAANYTTVETAVEGRWLQCNGVAVSRTTYADLFAYLNGLTPALPFGNGDGATTFTLPDLRGRAAWAEGEHADVDAMGDSDGATVTNRSATHRHKAQFGSSSVGGTVPVVTQFDNVVTASYQTTGNSTLEDKVGFQVVGSYFIKYVS